MNDAWKIEQLEALMKQFRFSITALEKLFRICQNFDIVMTKEFKNLFDAKGVLEMKLMKAQNQINLIEK